MACGIYQIINKTNGKFYIGQSRNIKKRWRQHTTGLDKAEALSRGSYPLRAAFIKYGLKHFEFKIIEECAESILLAREQYWINQLRPEYNCNIWTPVRKKEKVKTGSKCWIQYHNYNKLGYLPGELALDEPTDNPEEQNDFLSGVSTGKRAVLSAEGDTVFMVVGIGENPKQYYLMYRFIIEEIQIRETIEAYEKGDILYDAFGDGWFINPPQLLNSSDFDEFKKYCGNFGFGFMSVDKSNYLATLNALSEKYRSERVDSAEYMEGVYSKVLAVNPNELSVLEKRGAARHLALSLYPDEAILVLERFVTKIVLFDISEIVIRYRHKLLIHTLSFYEDVRADFRSGLQEGCLSLLNQFNLDQDTFPAHAIQGWVRVDNVLHTQFRVG